MDGLSAVLDQIRLNSVIYFKSAFAPDWGMDVPQGVYAQFHIIAEGECCFKCAGEATKELTAGDILIFPNGTAHWLAHTLQAKKINGQEVQMALWLAVQELKAENDVLKERLLALEKRVFRRR